MENWILVFAKFQTPFENCKLDLYFFTQNTDPCLIFFTIYNLQFRKEGYGYCTITGTFRLENLNKNHKFLLHP